VPDSKRAVDEIAAAILEGTPIDWPAAETGASAEDRLLLEELRLVCTVAEFHRHPPAPEVLSPDGNGDSAAYWGRLRLIERIGGGTFGDVYRAWDPRLHREVALKLIAAPENSGSRSAAIIREGRLLARVRHAGVVTIYDAERIGAQVGLSMELVEGATIEDRLQQDGVFTVAETVDIGLQLCDALSAVHRAGVLHRDVKAANVVVKADGRIVLMDFGAGRQLDDAFAMDLTGTPLYLAPEVLEGQEATVCSDIYSVGVLLHHMLTGSYPVRAESLSELRLAHTRRGSGERGREPPLSIAVPNGLAAVLDRATDPSPGRRPEDAAALAAGLRALQGVSRKYGWAFALSVAGLVVMMAAGGAILASRRQHLEAYTLYVQGQTALDRFTPDGILLAHRLFQQALAIDPDYPEAHAALAQVYLQMNPVIPNLSGEEALRRASVSAARALSLDGSLTDAHLAGAMVKSARADWSGAERGYRRAIELNPRHVVARQEYGRWLSLLGRFDEALEQARVAESLAPMSPRAVMSVAGVLRFARRYEEALVQSRKALDMDHGHVTAYSIIGHSHQGLEEFDQAIEAFLRSGRASGNLGSAYAQAGRVTEARAVLAQLRQRYDQNGLGAGEIAQIYSGLREVDSAFEWLDRVERVHAGWPTNYKVAAMWDPLRSDPRFTALLKRHGLAD
jgi:eukaryotic-like serine/threonine-protein kinase